MKRFLRLYRLHIILAAFCVIMLIALITVEDNQEAQFQADVKGCEAVGDAVDRDGRIRYRTIYKCPDGWLRIR